jgi:tetratricopeptide (TPR) repeat protein
MRKATWRWAKQTTAPRTLTPPWCGSSGPSPAQPPRLKLKQLLALQPDQPEALAELGQISLQARNYPQAETHFNAALRLDADNYLANFGLLQLYARTADPRRDQQSQRFDQIKSKKDERDLKMMRAIELRPDTGPDHHDTQSN